LTAHRIDPFWKGWYFRKKNITFSDMLASARRRHFDQRISRDHGKRVNTTKITLPRSTREPRFAKRANLLFISSMIISLKILFSTLVNGFIEISAQKMTAHSHF